MNARPAKPLQRHKTNDQRMDCSSLKPVEVALASGFAILTGQPLTHFLGESSRVERESSLIFECGVPGGTILQGTDAIGAHRSLGKY
jgi:hypothetical protein